MKSENNQNILDLNFRLTKVLQAKQRDLAGLMKTAVAILKENSIVIMVTAVAK